MMQGHIANKLVGPELFKEFVFCDHAVTVLEQVSQDIEHLWLQLAGLASMAEFIELGVECTIAKDVKHLSSLQPPDRGAVISHLWTSPSYHSILIPQEKLQQISRPSPLPLQALPPCWG
jgi:hypothetical protein